MVQDDITAALGDLPALAREHGLVVLAGAGISMAPPTSLPSWWDFNTAVLRALADRLEATSSRGWVAGRFEDLISRRNTLHAFTPDFMAQLMAEEVGADYFRVLQGLDTDRYNPNHAALADLAGAGLLRAVITTNFDRLIEAAMAARGVAYRVFADTAAFEQLSDALEHPGAPLPVIKAHGTVTDVASMVDTLAQRVAGRPKPVLDAIHTLLQRSPCLVLGFSGADLAYDPDYLALRPAAEDGIGLTVLARPGSEPLAPLRELVAAWGARGAFVGGALPEWLVALRDALGAAPAAAGQPAPTAEPADADWPGILAERCRAWVHSLGTVPALNMFTSLVDTNADDDQMLRYLMFFRRYYRSTEDAQMPTYWRFEYNLGRRLLDRGLIGTIDPHEDGLVLEGQRDVEAQAYADAFQFLARSADASFGGAMIEGQADLIRCLALKLGHGHVSGNVSALIKSLPPELEIGDARRTLQICWLAAEFGEEFGNLEAALMHAQIAYHLARALGDEPRRGAIAARAARICALKNQYGDAEWLADEASQIGARLSLPVLRGDALAARGMLDVLRSRDPDAVAPLDQACALFRRNKRRPRLAYALCDLARARYYSGSADGANSALEEARGLARLLPGLAVQALLAEMELLMHAEQWDGAKASATDLLAAATDLKHEAGIRRAQRALARIAEHAGAGGAA
jgi:hypothetical protein